MNKLDMKIKILKEIRNEIKTPSEIKNDLRLWRKSQLVELKNQFNSLYSQDQVIPVYENGKTYIMSRQERGKENGK